MSKFAVFVFAALVAHGACGQASRQFLAGGVLFLSAADSVAKACSYALNLAAPGVAVTVWADGFVDGGLVSSQVRMLASVPIGAKVQVNCRGICDDVANAACSGIHHYFSAVGVVDVQSYP